MQFLNPSILYALVLGSIPIIIYYLMRYRSLKVTWGANYVLERALDRLRKKLYLDQIILLALRVLACLAIVMAFARPASSDKSSEVAGSGVHHVIVVDGSYSMLAGLKDQTRWGRGIAALKNLTASWAGGEMWSLYLADENPHWVVESGTISSPQKTAEILDSLRPTESSASLARAMEAVAAKGGDRKIELTLLADDQALTWKGADRVAPPAKRTSQSYWINPPLEDRTNLAVTSVRFAGQRVLANHPLRVFTAIKNCSADPVQEKDVEILLDGRFFAKEAVSLLPGQESWVQTDVKFDTAGPHYVTARLAADALEYDNTMSAGVEVSDKIHVLVLRDKARSGKLDSAWDFLRVTSQVEKLVDGDGAPIFTMGPLNFTLCEQAVDAKVLATADVVLLDGGKALTTELAGQLNDYVAAGGGLVLAADGNNIDAAAWNDLLGRNGLLPAPLSRLHVEDLGGERFVSLARNEFGAEAMRPFETDEDGDIANARFFRWYELGEPAANATVLARFSDRQPYMVARRGDLGCTILLASGLSGRGNNLVAREFFLPMIFRVFTEAASGNDFPRTLARKQPIRIRVGAADTIRGVTFAMEGREPAAVPVTELKTGGAAAVIPDGADVTGLGSMLVARVDGSARAFYGIQGQRVDSDLTAMESPLKKAIIDRMGLVEVADWTQLDEVLKASRSSSEWYYWAIIAMLALLTSEMLMQRRFV